MQNQENKNTGIASWIDKRLPVFTFINHNLRDYPTPINLNYFWNFGSLAGVTLVIMIVTGILLAMQYTANTDLAFDSENNLFISNYGVSSSLHKLDSNVTWNKFTFSYLKYFYPIDINIGNEIKFDLPFFLILTYVIFFPLAIF